MHRNVVSLRVTRTNVNEGKMYEFIRKAMAKCVSDLVSESHTAHKYVEPVSGFHHLNQSAIIYRMRRRGLFVVCSQCVRDRVVCVWPSYDNLMM